MELIARLSSLIPIERIYQSDFEFKGTRFRELTILFPGSGKMHLTEARPLAGMVMADYPEYRFRIFYIQEIRQALKDGSMVFYTICRAENLIYQSERYKTVLITTALTAKAVLRRTKRNFRKELKKVAGFRDGFQFYLKHENYPFAALMLHQVIELSYRIAELMVTGREKITHSIRNHQKLMQQYVPELGAIFNEDDEDELKLLSLLDEAYQSVRYENTYTIDRDQLLALLIKADLLDRWITELYKLAIKQYVNIFLNYH
jgi:hypothetical protein